MNKIKIILIKLFHFLDSRKNLKLLRKIGFIVSAISIIFILNEFDNQDFNISDIGNSTYVFSVFLMMISYIFFGINWAEFLFQNLKLGRKNSFIFWNYSNLGKYIPGFIGIPLLRISQSDKVKSKLLFSGMLQEQLTPILIIIPSTVFLLSFTQKVNYLVTFSLFIFLFLRLFKFIFIQYKFFEIKKSYITKTLLLFAGFIFQYLAIYYVCKEVIQDMPHQLALLYSLSSALSLIFVGSPSGIGVREFLLFQLTKNVYLNQSLFTVMIVIRIVYFTVDLVSGVVGLLFASKTEKKTN